MSRLAGFGRPRAIALAAVALLSVLAGCSKHPTKPPAVASRSYRMGFAASAPRAEFPLLLQSIQIMIGHSDAAIMSNEAPWESLLAGTRPDSFVMRQQKPLADYYRGSGLRVWVYVDPANGLNRAGEANPLVAAGRSITEPAIQQLYRRYCVALDTLLHPDVFGVALETNLIRVASPPSLYDAVRQVANDAAADIRAHDASVRLSASVQVETAWGLLPNAGSYQGIATDFADFPFVEVLGLSSYPYFAFVDPDSVPVDYYARLVQGHAVPIGITEGGWTSGSFSTVVGTPDLQRRYLARQAQLLDRAHAIGLFQLLFTDIQVSALTASQAQGIAPFSRTGVLDTLLASKSALSAWDATFGRPFAP